MKRVWIVATFAAAGWAQAPNSQPAAATAQTAPATQTAPAGQTAPTAAAALNTTGSPTAAPTGGPPSSAASPSPQAAMAASQAAMAASLAQQRASVVKQVSAVTGKAPASAASFFTVPWVESSPQFIASMAASFNVPPCDPLPDDQLNPLIEQNAQRQSVQAALIRAVISEESGGRPCAVSVKGAQGLMQLMPSMAGQFGVTDPFDPKQNVEAGSKLLKQLLAKYNGDLRLALSAYNAGSDRVDKDGGVPQIPETMNYVNDILAKLPKQ